MTLALERPAARAMPYPPAAADPPGAAGLPAASVIIVNTNELHHLRRCLPAIARQDYPGCEVLVVDNASTDGSIAYVATEYPWVRLVRNETNLGYAGANNVGFRHATGDYIAVLNPDTEVRPGWLRELIRALEADPAAGLATPKILMMDDPSRINTCGNEITLTGLTFCRGLDEPADRYDRPEVVSAVSGAAFAIRREVLERIGGFDESFFIYFEETDLSLRAALAGFRCRYVPTATVLHKYDFRFSARKCYLQERNRAYALLKNLRWPTFVALLPGLAIAEVIAWGYAALQGREHRRAKLQGYGWLIANRRQIAAARREIQALRRVGDRRVIGRFGHRLNFARTVSPAMGRALGLLATPPLLAIKLLSRALVWW